MDSSQLALLGDQQFQERSEQAFAPNADVMHELKEAQVERQLFLRNSSMGSQPGTHQGPETLSGIDMNLMEAIAIVVAGVFAPAVTHRIMKRVSKLRWLVPLFPNPPPSPSSALAWRVWALPGGASGLNRQPCSSSENGGLRVAVFVIERLTLIIKTDHRLTRSN
jgi:hypothetical protein